MHRAFDYVALVIELYVFVLIAAAILSWVPTQPGTPLARLAVALRAVTEPVLRPVRRLIPPVRAGGAAIDLSVLIVLLVAELVVIPLLRS